MSHGVSAYVQHDTVCRPREVKTAVVVSAHLHSPRALVFLQTAELIFE